VELRLVAVIVGEDIALASREVVKLELVAVMVGEDIALESVGEAIAKIVPLIVELESANEVPEDVIIC
jgi:hypothetical protein